MKIITVHSQTNLGEARAAQAANPMVIKISMANRLPILPETVMETGTPTARIVIARIAQIVILMVMKINMENPN